MNSLLTVQFDSLRLNSGLHVLARTVGLGFLLVFGDFGQKMPRFGSFWAIL